MGAAPAGARELGGVVGGVDGHTAVFGRFFALQADESQRLSFTYVTPPVLEQAGETWIYTLRLQRQPGWEFESVTLTVQPPPGMRPTSATVDGEPAATASALSLDLSQDRVVTVSFAAGS